MLRRDTFGYLGEDGPGKDNLLSVPGYLFPSFYQAALIEFGKNIVFEASWKTLSCFLNVLIGKMIDR